MDNFFKYLGSPISWWSKKLPVVALSTYEVEYIASVLSACQAVLFGEFVVRSEDYGKQTCEVND